MLKSLPFIMLVGVFALNALFPSVSLADYYKYTDSKGVVNITNKLQSVPAKYRSTMKVVRESPKKEAAAAPAQEPASQVSTAEPDPAAQAASAPAPAGKFAELSSRFVWFKPLVYIAAIVALFIAVAKLTTVVPSPVLSKLIYISFFMGVMVFVYKAYVEHVAASTQRIKDNAVSIIKKSSAREEIVLPGDEPPAQK